MNQAARLKAISETLINLSDEIHELLEHKEPIWFDVDARYYSLEDIDKTPMNVKWIKDGDIRLESENNSHCYTGSFNGIETWLTKLPNEN